MKCSTVIGTLAVLAFLLLPLHCPAQLSQAQLTSIDSLNTVIRTAPHDTIRIEALRMWDDIIYADDPELDILLNKQIDSISTAQLTKNITETERKSFLKSKGFATGNLGYIYNEKGNNTLALKYLNASLEAKQQLGDQQAVARVLNNIGSIYHEQVVYNTAIEYYSQALAIYKQNDLVKEMAGTLNNLAIIHRYQQHYETALDYYEQSLDIKIKSNDSSGIAVAYLNMGTLYKEMKSYDKARELTLKSLAISEELQNERTIALAHVNLGSIYDDEQQLRTALEYYLRGFAMQNNINDGKMLGETAVYIGQVYLDLDNVSKALEYGELALKLAYENDVAKVVYQASELLYQIHKATGDNQRSLEMLELNIKIKDSIDSYENRKAAIRNEFQRAYEKDSVKAAEADKVRDAQLAQEIAERERQEQQIYYLIGSLALALLFGAFIFNRFRVTRKQRDIIEIQKERVDVAYGALHKEKKKSDTLLLNILPEEVAEELKSTGTSTPKHYDQVSVLFTDFKGFTKSARHIEPQELVQTLNECFSAFDTIIDAHNMEKIKTIGDAYMCAGGVPIQSKDNAFNAVKAAAEMIAWIDRWNKKREAQGLSPWEIRIGIHTGELVAGVIGSKKFAYDVWGDAVNVASRMESYGEPGKVNISEETNSLIKNAFRTEYRGEIEIKNRGAVGMYFVQTE